MNCSLEEVISWLESNECHLTSIQIAVLKYKVRIGTFLGIGKILGAPGKFPLFKQGNHLECIDAYGYGQFASLEGRMLYEANNIVCT